MLKAGGVAAAGGRREGKENVPLGPPPAMRYRRAGDAVLAAAVAAGGGDEAAVRSTAPVLPAGLFMAGGKRPPPTRMSAKAWVVVDADTGSVVGGHNHMNVRSVASLTKIVTASVVLQYAALQPDLLKDTVVVSRVAARTIGTSARLQTGDELSVMDALYGLMLPSGNDAAMALAEHVGARRGGLKHPCWAEGRLRDDADSADTADDPGQPARTWFVAQMNTLAAAWGTSSTRFSNPHGMDAKPDPDTHMSTALDVATLARHAMRDAVFRKVVATKRYTAVVVRRRRSSVPDVAVARGRHPPRRMDPCAFPALASKGGGVAARSGSCGDVLDGFAGATDTAAHTAVAWDNTNKMLSSRVGVDGVKTGVTRNAGPCLCTRVTDGTHTVMVVVLQCASKEARYSETLKLARWSRRRRGGGGGGHAASASLAARARATAGAGSAVSSASARRRRPGHPLTGGRVGL